MKENRLKLIAKVIETLILVPIFFLVFTSMSDRIILAFIVGMTCMFAVEGFRNWVVKMLLSSKR